MNIRNIIIITTILTIISSCTSDWLELDPVVNKTLETHYKTEEDMNQAVISAYDPLQWNATNFQAHEYHNFGMLSNILSDDCWSGGGGAGDRLDYMAAEQGDANASSIDFYGMYTTNYRGICRSNIVINRLKTAEDINEEIEKQFEGEAKFLRALYYFRLVRMWRNIPLVVDEMQLSEIEKMPQADPNDIYNQVAKDLYEAYTILPDSYDQSNLGRATKWAAGSLLVRVYLYASGYNGTDLVAGDITIDQAKAIEIADNIITTSGHALTTLDKLFISTNENNIESIFEVQFTESAQWGAWAYMMGQSGNMMVNFVSARGTSDPYADGWSYSTVSKELYAEFDKKDPRRDLSVFNPGGEQISYTQAYQNTGYFIGKYKAIATDHGVGGDKRFNHRLNEVLIRYSDLLLMAAELNLNVNTTKALGYINLVRTRALGEDAALSSIDLDAIYHERRIELAGEGHRYWDLLRRGIPYAEKMINGTNVDGSDEFISIFNTESKGLMPIPQNEIDLSGQRWSQNPGY